MYIFELRFHIRNREVILARQGCKIKTISTGFERTFHGPGFLISYYGNSWAQQIDQRKTVWLQSSVISEVTLIVFYLFYLFFSCGLWREKCHILPKKIGLKLRSRRCQRPKRGNEGEDNFDKENPGWSVSFGWNLWRYVDAKIVLSNVCWF